MKRNFWLLFILGINFPTSLGASFHGYDPESFESVEYVPIVLNTNNLSTYTPGYFQEFDLFICEHSHSMNNLSSLAVESINSKEKFQKKLIPLSTLKSLKYEQPVLRGPFQKKLESSPD